MTKKKTVPKKKPAKNPWIKWTATPGSQCPVDWESTVEFELETGRRNTSEARLLLWHDLGNGTNICAYRVVKHAAKRRIESLVCGKVELLPEAIANPDNALGAVSEAYKAGYERGMKDASVTTRTFHHYEASPNHYHWGWMLLMLALGVLAGWA